MSARVPMQAPCGTDTGRGQQSWPRRLCVAPMMERTDRYCRYFLRQLAPNSLLYTEMVTAAAVLHGDRERLLGFHPAEHPLALQLGGSSPAELATAAAIGAARGYDEINLNVGCPSSRVRSGRFGACLMLEPGLVAECVAAMREAVDVPVTVKTRIGVDERDDDEFLDALVAAVSAAGCQSVIVHARKAWLRGLSPRQNREIPPLRYDRVHRLKRTFPGLEIVLNGGIDTVDQVLEQLLAVDGVMLGREVYRNPYLLAVLQRALFGATEDPLPAREQIVRGLLPYIAEELARGVRLHAITRHMLGLFHGCTGARQWRRHLSERAVRPGAGVEEILAALAHTQRGERPRAGVRSDPLDVSGSSPAAWG